MTAKELVLNFYQSDAFLDVELMKSYIHPEILLDWHSSKGFFQMNADRIIDLTEKFSIGYSSSRIKINQIIEENNIVSVSFSHFAKAIENPSEEMRLAHFMVFWEIKDNKLFRGFQMSQLS